MIDIASRMFSDATEKMKGWRKPLLVTHAKPDGDALGSLVAMRAFLREMNAEPMAALFDPIPQRYAIFERFDRLPVLGSDLSQEQLVDCDSIVILDTCTYSQLGPIADWLQASGLPKLAVDHHISRDDLATLYVVDETAAATCQILTEWAQVAGWSIDADVADALFVGLAMDTGWFRHSNVNAQCLACSTTLVERGAKPHLLYEELFHRESEARLRLAGAALQSMEFSVAGQMAVMCLTPEVMTSAGATPADTEDIVNEPLRIATVVVSVLLVEQEDGVIRASFRSKAPSRDRSIDVDVAAVAGLFGGGGHRRAAGARISGLLQSAKQEIKEKIGQIIQSP